MHRPAAPARIAFAGTPAFSVPTLATLARSAAAVTLVLTQPDRPAGRGRKLTPSPVKVEAEALGVPVVQPAKLNDAALLDALGAPPDLMVVIAYGLLLPTWLLAWPRLGCVNLHASLLPRWRGAAPIQHAILAGDTTTGVSLMQMERGLDTGSVFATRTTQIGTRESAADLQGRLAEIAAALMADTLSDLLAGKLAAIPQREDLATVAAKIAKADARLDWRRDASALARQVRAFNPWPVAETESSAGERLRIWTAEVVTAHGRVCAPGTIIGLAEGIDVACGDGILRLLEVQPPSARAMSARAYLAAHALEGQVFVA
jgi:methionyl-tRNA formyltransferase